MSTPIVPPRPTRANPGPTVVTEPLPHIPPRPVRKLDPSPAREEYSRSPLNELPDTFAKPAPRRLSRGLTPADVPARPPSVSLPSVGQEGSEYASYDQLPPEAHGVDVAGESAVGEPHQTRNVSATMPLHAPTASFAQSTAKSRIANVTRTDSTQAAAIGIGRARPEDDVHRTPADSTLTLTRVPSHGESSNSLRRVASAEPHPLSQRTQRFSQSTPLLTHGTSRPGSIYEGSHEHGIPEIGRQIPLNPNAGDAQAPTPGNAQSQHAPGIGFFNDGSARNHHRKRSSRHEFGPPDSYGLHGHGVEPRDKFEREWAAKHPKEAATEGYNVWGHFHVPRPPTALSTEELNKIVGQSTEAGVATSPAALGTPSWEIANQATEEYTSRYSSPKPHPPSTSERTKRASTSSQRSNESSLRHVIFADGDNISRHENVIVKEDGTIHINPLERSLSHVTGSGPADGTLDLGPQSGNTAEKGGWYDERGFGTPILASDEIVKRPSSAFRLPAVSPELKPVDYDSDHGDRRRSVELPSRPSSRPGSQHGNYHGGNLHRFISHEEYHGSGVHTPLEEIEEYEPLFPEEEEAKVKPKPFLRRPGLEHHHFPSQDIWEDTPSSLQYQATVETPEPQHETISRAAADTESTSAAFETPEQEASRRAQNPDNMLSEAKMVSKPIFKANVRDEVERPGIQRFPSQDIWEDTPDSMRLETTVSSPQVDELKSPTDDGPEEIAAAATLNPLAAAARPTIPARPQRKSKLAEEVKPENVDDELDEKADDGASSPASQLSPTTSRTAPAIPDRPKPTVPSRPAARSVEPGVDAAPAPPAKQKPAVPARPVGEKIAALKAGFMNDLNQRLKIGPQAPKPREPETTDEADASVAEAAKAPLADARKSRARGPARRKPGAGAGSDDADVTATGPVFSFLAPATHWHIDGASGALHVPSADLASGAAAAETAAGDNAVTSRLESELSANTAANTAEPALGQRGSEAEADAEGVEQSTIAEAASAEPTFTDASATALREKVLEVQDNSAVVGEASAEPTFTDASAEALREKVLEARGVNSEAEAGESAATTGGVAEDSSVAEAASADPTFTDASADALREKVLGEQSA